MAGPESARTIASQVCHRAKNDFQTIVNLLDLACPYMGSAQELVESIQGRVGALSVCYSMVGECQAAPTLDLLADEVLRRLLWRRGDDVRVDKRIPAVPLSLRLCSPLSLWLHEILSNALDHGASGASSDHLSLSALMGREEFVLRVADNGPGLPPGFDLERHAHLGLRLARAVAQSDLRGHLDLMTGASGGLEVSLSIPVSEMETLNRDLWT